MGKKAFLWAKKTELWINLAQIYTLFLCFFIVKWQLWGTGNIEKYVPLFAIILLPILAIRYELYRSLSGILYILFFTFACIPGLLEGLDIKKIIASPIQRVWYLYLTVLVVGYVLKDRKKDRWIYAMFFFQAIILASVFLISIVGATRNLINPGYEPINGFGTFISGRLSTFKAANTAGPAAAVLILISILLIYRSKEMRCRFLLNILYCIFLLIGWVELGLSRSRGAIVAAAVGVGVFFFILVYEKKESNKFKGFVLGLVVCMFVTLAAGALFLLPKTIYDKAITAYSQKVNPSETERINESLEVYGITYSIENLTDRTDIWSATIRMLNEKPERWIWGVTAQHVLEVPILDAYVTRPEISMETVHNGYLEQLYVFGIPGASILAVLLCIWLTRAVKVVFSKEAATKDKTMVSLMAAACVNAMVEAFLFPYYILYPISFFFFMAEGCVEGTMKKKESSLKKKIVIGVLAVTAMIAVALLTRRIYLNSKKDYEFVKDIEIKEQDTNDFIRLNNGISHEMMKAGYWTELRRNKGEETTEEELSLAQIERLNNLNRRMISTTGVSFSLEEIDDVFYYKVAVSLIKDTMPDVGNPEDYLIDSVPTDASFWEEAMENANLDALTERISVKFGISVSNTILKRYPTDAKVFYKNSNLYYDELAQSDLLPFMPVAVLHESKDANWYYVITYGYGGWVRKENIALCKTKEEWLKRSHPDDFLVVTGKEIRIPTDPYTEQLSDIIVPMGTILPVVNLEEAPEELHGRISFGNYVVKLPVRNGEGMAEDVFVLIPGSEDVNLGYLPYTEENVAALAFKHLGEVYGWAGDNNGQDCSGLVREIYTCFGLNLPRTAKAQSDMECSQSYNVSSKGYKEKMDILENAPIGTLLYFPGHIMLYLGTDEGRPYCISSTGNYATAEMNAGEIKEVNTVILTDMIDTKRSDGKSWIENVTQIVIP